MSLLDTFKKAVEITGESRWEFARAIFICLLAGCVELIGIGALYPFLSLLARPEIINTNAYIHEAFIGLGFSDTRLFLIFCGILTLLALVASNVIMLIKNAYITKYSIRQMRNISSKMFKVYLEQPFESHLNSTSGAITKNVIDQTDAVTNTVLIAVMSLISEGFILLLVAFILVMTNPAVSVVMLALIGVTMGLLLSATKERVVGYGRLCDEINASRYSFVLSSVQAIKEIKAFGKEAVFVSLFSIIAGRMSSYLSKLMIIQLLPNFFMQIVASGTVILLAIFYLAKGDAIELIVPSLLFLGAVGLRLMPSMSKISNSITALRQNESIVGNVHQVLASLHGSKEIHSGAPVIEGIPEIEFKNVCFAYRGRETEALHGLSLIIPPNKVTAIIGHSGAGKTTLIDLMLGLLVPSKGYINIQGHSLHEFSRYDLSKIYAYVHQALFILDGSIADNVAFGVAPEEIDWALMRQASHLSNLDEVIASRSDGWNFQVGERGGRLSGGQRQRLGIARALYASPKILILDESTNALDGAMEASIVDTLHELKAGMSVVLVAHSKAVIRRCDWIVMLEKGQVVAAGPYQTLVKENSQVARFVEG